MQRASPGTNGAERSEAPPGDAEGGANPQIR